MKQSNLLNAQFARRLFRTAFSSWQLLAVMLIVCMNVAVGSKLYAQSNTIAVKGKVMADGEPVIGATVLVKGVSTGTATDMDGNFSLNVASKAVLVVSSIGYETQEVPVNGRQFINVVLKSDVVALKDVVVVGYGVQKKVNLTGAVSSVSTDELEGKPISNVLEAMQGTTPGLVIQQGSSTPGSVPSINIRGLNTMNNNDPLVIIDGIEGSLANLNPADIEQISILKDASSTAIYGSRASNGVVLVTTKKGKAGKVEISYDFMYGVQQPTSLPKIADSWVYAELYNEAAVNSGRAAKFTPEQIAQYRNGGPNVNWVKELYNRNSPQSSHNVSMTGGNDQLSYMASLGYMDQNSMFKGPDYGYKRYNARLNVSHKVTNNFTLNLTSQFARNDIKEHAYWTEWIIEQANRMPPIYPIKNEDGSYNYPAGSNSNGLQRLEEGGYRQNVNDELLGTIQAEWEVYKGLKLIGSAGGRVWNNNLHENRKAFEGTGDSENKLTDCDTATSHNHYIAYVGIVFFAGYLTYIRNVFAGSGEINNVMQFNNIVSARDNRFRSAFDGHYVVRNVGTAQLVQRYIQDFSLFAHLRTNQNQRTSAELPPLAYPAHAHGRYDFFSSQHFRVNQRIYSQLLEKLFIFG